MPNINDMIESKFLKKENVGRGVLVTVTNVATHNVAVQGAPEERKWCLEFQEEDKPLVLNVTNMRIMASLTGSENTDDWIGKKIVLYNDPTISYAGKITGGIRIRAPKPGSVPPDAQDQMAKDTTAAGGNQIPDEDIPF